MKIKISIIADDELFQISYNSSLNALIFWFFNINIFVVMSDYLLIAKVYDLYQVCEYIS